MIQFANPGFLFLLLAVPIIVWLSLKRRQMSLRFPSTAIFVGLPVGRVRVARWIGSGVWGLAFSLLLIALAGPRWPDSGTRLPTQGIAIMMVVDASGSMAER